MITLYHRADCLFSDAVVDWYVDEFMKTHT